MIRKAITFVVIIGLLVGLYKAVDGDLITVFDQALYVTVTAVNFVADIATPIWESIFS